MRVRMKPVEVEAVQWCGVFDNEVREVVMHNKAEPKGDELLILTLEGAMVARPGDWIIRSMRGECHLRKPEDFEATYESVTEETPSWLTDDESAIIDEARDALRQAKQQELATKLLVVQHNHEAPPDVSPDAISTVLQGMSRAVKGQIMTTSKRICIDFLDGREIKPQGRDQCILIAGENIYTAKYWSVDEHDGTLLFGSPKTTLFRARWWAPAPDLGGLGDG